MISCSTSSNNCLISAFTEFSAQEAALGVRLEKGIGEGQVITCALMASFAICPTVFEFMESTTDFFAQKKFSKDLNFEMCYRHD